MATFVAHPRRVGALIPTSESTVRAMLDMTPWENVSRVVELGAGTGVYTDELLRRVGPDSEVVAVEIDPRLAHRLSDRFDDRRLRVVRDSAERLSRYVAPHTADVVVSALPFTTLPAAVRETVYAAIARTLAPDGVMLALQYSSARQRDFEQGYASIRRRWSLRNLPPALLYACRQAVRGPKVDA
jgi:phospholipid N-methyltransferase